MARKRASLAGRGVEILFGGEPENQPESGSVPEEATPTSTDAGEPLSEQPVSDVEGVEAEWVALLEAEAETATVDAEPSAEPDVAVPVEPAKEPVVTGEPSSEDGQPVESALDVTASVDELVPPAEEETKEPEESLPDLATAPALPDEELPPLATTPAGSAGPAPAMQVPTHVAPEVETMPYESPTAAPVSTYEPETPPSPMYTEPHVEPGAPSAPLPPPKEKPEAYDPVVQAQLVGALYQTQTEAPPEERLRPDGPTTTELELPELAEYEVGQPARRRAEREVLDYVGIKQRQALWQEISELYRQVPEVLSTDALQDEALQLLRQAQDILMEKPRQFDVAQYSVGQVKSILTRRKNIVRWTNTYGWGALLYETLWIVALGAAVLFAPAVVLWVEAIVGPSTGLISVAQLWNTAAWGSVGGVLGALYSLYWHAAQVKDFDKQYLMWYIVQPVIGVIIGALVYVVIGAGFINLIGETQSGQQTPLQLFPYAVACIAGFRQRFILEVVDRVIQFLTGAGSKQEQPRVGEKPPVEPPPPPKEQ